MAKRQPIPKGRDQLGTEPVPPKPVLKWAGGKSRLTSLILAKLPDTIGTYYEPFLGSAAVFFQLASEGRFRRAVLGDKNPDLIDVYQALQTDVDELIRVLERKRYTTIGEEAYYQVRSQDPRKLNLYERAARTIYLNKTGYNGLYRVNRAGDFNVPFGRYKNPTIFDPRRLAASARALEKVKLVVGDFEELVQGATKGDAVYFDPPYVPLSKTSNFTAYSKDAFEAEHHKRLSEVFRSLAKRGVVAVLSNSDTELTSELYESWDLERITVTRPINSNAQKRGGVTELLVRNVRKKNRRTP